jgi:hypothetical protein
MTEPRDRDRESKDEAGAAPDLQVHAEVIEDLDVVGQNRVAEDVRGGACPRKNSCSMTR